uniref:Retrotransposon gag domain-containing protein n=1 Tax=Ananas comosus var. bracteatus TaxID=296719 RepID=A0A6V7PVI9_ANACO|nr:unnamed protein product [Ananas comosus var. bracteatus]
MAGCRGVTVPLAAHYLEDEAYSWWLRLFEKNQYFKDSTKLGLEHELERLKQGNRTMAEYEQDFSCIVGLILFVVRNEYHKAQMFARGLKPNIRILIASHGVMTFDECLDRALMVQNDMEEAQIERDASEKNGDKKRSHFKSSGGSFSNKRPQKHPRTQQSARSVPSGNQR